MNDSVPVEQRSSWIRPLLPHLGWEVVLLLAVIVVTVVARADQPGRFESRFVWSLLAVTLAVAIGFALSVRTGTPNLAVGAIVPATGYWYATMVSDGTSSGSATVLVLFVTLLAGAAVGVLVGLTSLPSWAVTLVALALVQGITRSNADPQGVPIPGTPTGTGTFQVLVVALGLISVAGAIACSIPSVQRVLSANRSTEDPGRFRPAKVIGAVVGLAGSSVLAALAGILLIRYTQFALPGDVGLWLPIAVVIVVVGGVSVFGRYGGVFGVVLASILVVTVQQWMNLRESAESTLLMLGLLGLFGLGVNRLLEFLDQRLTPGATGATGAGVSGASPTSGALTGGPAPAGWAALPGASPPAPAAATPSPAPGTPPAPGEASGNP